MSKFTVHFVSSPVLPRFPGLSFHRVHRFLLFLTPRPFPARRARDCELDSAWFCRELRQRRICTRMTGRRRNFQQKDQSRTPTLFEKKPTIRFKNNKQQQLQQRQQQLR